jgi:hypothetical protein
MRTKSRGVLACVLAAVLASCTGALRGGTIGGGDPRPNLFPPAVFDVVVCAAEPVDGQCRQPVAGATVLAHLGDGTYAPSQAPTNADGYVLFKLGGPLPDSDVIVTAAGYLEARRHIDTAAAGHNFVVVVPAFAPAGETGALVTDRAVFRTADGTARTWRGCTDFLLLYRLIAGEDLQPLLQDRIAVGCRTLRVLGMVDSFAHLHPQEVPDYVGRVRQLADYLAARGLRMEFVVFADAQIIMPDPDQERAHLLAVFEALRGLPLVTIEVANEPFKNLPGGDKAAQTLAFALRGRGVLVSSGAYTDWPPLPTADYGTTHADRKDDWPRTGKDLFDLAEVTKTPWVSDEPMGAAEVDQPGKRSAVPDDFAWFGAAAAMLGAGATFHSDAGILSLPYGPGQRACALAFFYGLTWVPGEAPLWPYQRGDAGSEAGFGNMPIRHDDAVELRSFCKGNAGEEWCVQIRTKREHATPRDGWRVVDEPRRGFVHLAR